MEEKREHRNKKKRYENGMFDPRRDNVGIVAEYNRANNIKPRKDDYIDATAKLSNAKLRDTR